MTAPKKLATTIRLIPHGVNVQTVVARFRCVPWIDKYQFYCKFNALINQELPQLVEAPTIAMPTLSFSSRQFIRAFPDAAQVFKRNYLVVCFGFFNQLVADCMVLVCLKAFLSGKVRASPLSPPLRTGLETFALIRLKPYFKLVTLDFVCTCL